ncbi:MAG TPA: phage protein Gp36 family protein [Nocardioides sp.]|nr:phage protein Gp36 family protein [Nocardioides sp.]
MAAYATPAGLRTSLTRDPQHPEGTAADLPDATLQQAIDAATGQVDARLNGRYPTPFGDPVPPLITAIVLAIAAYLADLGYRQSVDSTAQDPVAKRYQWATDLLSRLVNGSANIPGVHPRLGLYPVPRYEGQLFDLEGFGLGVENDPALLPPSRWSGPWDN